MKVSIDSLRESLKQHKVKGFENSMYSYFFCLYYSKGISDIQWLQFVKGEARYGLIDAIQFCADYGINPVDDHFDIYFSDRSQIKNGDFLYEDGSFSHEKSKSKIVIARIVLSKTSDYEASQGWTHGYIIPISPIGEGYIISERYEYGKVLKFMWSIDKADLPFPHTHYTMDDLSHWDEIEKVESEYFIKIANYYKFPAFGAVQELNTIMPVPLSGSSPWLLPSISLFRRILGPYHSCIFLPYSGRECWTSSQLDQNHAASFDGNASFNVGFGCRSKDCKYPVLPIAVF